MKKILIALTIISSFTLSSLAISAEPGPVYYDFNSMPAHQLINTISMRFVTSDHFTVIQWDLKAGAKLMPQHKHPNEQVIRVLSGTLQVYSGDSIKTLHAGDVMIFAGNVPHGFIAETDAVMYEQQTPIRQDFLQEGFIEKLSSLLSKNQ
jgi:quercetin dioxygenase-like cupin family protein